MMRDARYAHATEQIHGPSAMSRRLRPGVVLAAAVLSVGLVWPGSVAAADNIPPVAVDDPGAACMSSEFGGAFPIAEDWGQFGFVGSCSAVANDTDSDGSIVAWQIVDLPVHGTLAYTGSFPDAFGYTPDPDWSTPAGDWISDRFTYRAIDDDGASSNLATMRFWIAPVNDAPSFVPAPDPIHGLPDTPYAQGWATSISAGPPNESGQAVHFEIIANDNPALFSVQPSIAPDGTLSFTAAPDQNGNARVTVVAKDDGGLEHYAGVPDRADDTSDPVTFSIGVSPAANRAPTATDDDAVVAEDSADNLISVLSNDTDPELDPLQVIGVSNASQGFAKALADGSALTYTPNPNASGSDSFNYTIIDGNGHAASATVHVTITPSNDAPDAADDGVPTAIMIGKGAGPISIPVLANDSTAPDTGETLVITAITQGSRGLLAITAGGTGLTYDPAGQTTGSDTFSYTVADGNGGSDTATVRVQIAKDATAPTVGAPVVGSSAPAGPGQMRLAVSWTAADPESGIASTQLQLRRDGGSWSNVSLPSPTASQVTVVVAAGHTYEFRVRATNGATPSETSAYHVGIPISV